MNSMDTCLGGVFQAGISRLTVRVKSFCDLGYESWSKKLYSPDFPWWKPHDPRFISFDALPACDGQTDIAKCHSSTAELDKNWGKWLLKSRNSWRQQAMNRSSATANPQWMNETKSHPQWILGWKDITSFKIVCQNAPKNAILRQILVWTSSSAVAKTPCDASCLSVVSFNGTKHQAQSSIISYTLALDLPLRKLNYVLFSLAYSLVHGFLCRKQTCTMTVIHHWMDDRQLIALAPAGINR